MSDEHPTKLEIKNLGPHAVTAITKTANHFVRPGNQITISVTQEDPITSIKPYEGE